MNTTELIKKKQKQTNKKKNPNNFNNTNMITTVLRSLKASWKKNRGENPFYEQRL